MGRGLPWKYTFIYSYLLFIILKILCRIEFGAWLGPSPAFFLPSFGEAFCRRPWRRLKVNWVGTLAGRRLFNSPPGDEVRGQLTENQSGAKMFLTRPLVVVSFIGRGVLSPWCHERHLNADWLKGTAREGLNISICICFVFNLKATHCLEWIPWSSLHNYCKLQYVFHPLLKNNAPLFCVHYISYSELYRTKISELVSHAHENQHYILIYRPISSPASEHIQPMRGEDRLSPAPRRIQLMRGENPVTPPELNIVTPWW